MIDSPQLNLSTGPKLQFLPRSIIPFSVLMDHVIIYVVVNVNQAGHSSTASRWVLNATITYFCIFAHRGRSKVLIRTHVLQVNVAKLNVFTRRMAAANQVHCNIR